MTIQSCTPNQGLEGPKGFQVATQCRRFFPRLEDCQRARDRASDERARKPQYGARSVDALKTDLHPASGRGREVRPGEAILSQYPRGEPEMGAAPSPSKHNTNRYEL
ncbi:hypothetical protein NDU88_007006 [Pleurodeles waltl]|uniref:Uncharacterized protein n=1 Tax=Pleurodeles waltl TaxID=8319 RepID=A0AAV7N287_PLEWA|nr:hypothetical protein NDU88_007006 [Pleurodeles waltl]